MQQFRSALRLAVGTAALLFFAAAPVAQGQVGTGPAAGPRAVPASAQLCAGFQVAAATTQDLAVPMYPGQQFLVDVVLGGRTVTMELHLHDVRSPAFRLLVADAAGIHAVPTPPCTTYEGSLLGEPDSDVACSVVAGQVRGIVIDSRGLWGIQPARDVDPNAGNSTHIVYSSRDNWNLPFRCGVHGAQQPGPSGSGDPTDALHICELACEVDFPMYQRFNNVTLAQNDVTNVVNMMNTIYRRDCEITHQITTILVRTTSGSDPYSSTDPGTLLRQFQSWWNANQNSVQRDTAHLFTGRPLNGSVIGIAFLGVICNRTSAYGLSETTFTTNITARVGLTSHEVGHNWNAQHCNASPDCRIMCSGLGGCSGILTSFGPTEISQIVGFRNTRTCLTQQSLPPVISTMLPNSMSAFGRVAVTVTGTNLTNTNRVDVGSQTITSGITVVNDTTLRFVPPAPPSIGSFPVNVTNPAGTSNSLPLFFTATSPCQMSAPTVGIGGTPIAFEFGGQVNNIFFLIVSLNSATGPLQGQQVLSSFSVLSIGQLNAAGLGGFSVVVPPAVLNGITIFSQFLEVDPAALTLQCASAVGSTRIFL